MGSDGVEDGRPYWLVDPIDGTSSFIRGLPNCTNMAALIIANQPVAAVLYDFVNDVLYTARKGGGAYRNSERLEVSDRTLDESVLYMGGFMIPDQFFKPLRAANVDIFRPIGASGHAYILLAEGKIEGYSLMDGAVSAHDHAPGMLLAREAGAVVSCAEDTDWDVRASNFIVSTPRIARLLSENGMQ
jgi:myo-inositol-1(or 4)-monophosphatase